MNSIQKNFSSIEQMTDQLIPKKAAEAKNKTVHSAFEEILLKKQTEELKFSRHANERLASRNINLSGEMLERLEQGTNRAREKGINESLVMVDGLAFIVNVKNNVVVTAVNDTEDAVFTNIDGAVFS